MSAPRCSRKSQTRRGSCWRADQVRLAFLVPAPDYPADWAWAYEAEAGALIEAGITVEPVPFKDAIRRRARKNWRRPRSPRPRSTYARVDIVVGTAGELQIVELELIEPALFLDYAPEAGAAFSRAILSAAERASEQPLADRRR